MSLNIKEKQSAKRGVYIKGKCAVSKKRVGLTGYDFSKKQCYRLPKLVYIVSCELRYCMMTKHQIIIIITVDFTKDGNEQIAE